jgi:N-acetylglutamate synthase-like GNAT family acetyltransferase
MGTAVGRKPKSTVADHGKAVSEHMVNVFKTDNRVVAIVEVNANSLFLLIENLAVSPAEQGKGIGAVLLIHVLELARSMGPSKVRL